MVLHGFVSRNPKKIFRNKLEIKPTTKHNSKIKKVNESTRGPRSIEFTYPRSAVQWTADLDATPRELCIPQDCGASHEEDAASSAKPFGILNPR